MILVNFFQLLTSIICKKKNVTIILVYFLYFQISLIKTYIFLIFNNFGQNSKFSNTYRQLKIGLKYLKKSEYINT